MNLIVPVASSGVTGTGDTGPGYAQNISSDLLTLIDAHDHSSGKGVQVTPAGLNISADLAFNTNNATALRAARFTSQASGLVGGADVAELYVQVGNLWYVNSSGVQVQITSGGGLATGITGGVGPAGAPGPPGTFSGVIGSPTGLWLPTGFVQPTGVTGFPGIVSWNAPYTAQSGTWTGTPITYTCKPGYGTVVSVLANIVGYDQGQGFLDVDVKQTFYVGSGAQGSGGFATGVGTFTYCYNQVNPNSPSSWPGWNIGSGWGVVFAPTGNQINLVLSVPTGGPSGTVKFSSMLQISERGAP